MAQPANKRLVTEAAQTTALAPLVARTQVILLEAGQTVSDYETAHSVTVPVGAIIYQKA